MNIFSQPHRAGFRFGFGAFVVFAMFPLVAVSQSELKWETVNPFHFIKDQDAIDELRSVYDDLKIKSAHELEKTLQRNDEQAVDDRRKDALKRCEKFTKLDKERCEERAKLPYLGWFARIARNNHAGTCWDSSALEFRDEGSCKDYMAAPSHRVRVWVENPVSTDFLAWEWEKESVKLIKPKQCDPKYERPICVEFEVNDRSSVLAGATAPNGSKFSVVVRVEDIMIAGLGDSYAAGEGNPDIPAQFLERQSETDFVWFWKFRRSARKDIVDQDVGGLAEVAWLDKRCHRSMYSYQFKAALQYALENPQRSVTFASVSCSGAELPELIWKRQVPKEQMKGATVYRTVGDRKTIRPQIEAMKELLGKRGIDFLLLSIGGNDAGFAKYVAHVMLSGKTLWLAGLSNVAKTPKEKRIAKAIAKLEGDYRTLNGHLQQLSFRDGIPPSKRIVLMAYPNFLESESEKPCTVTRNEFTVPFNKDSGRTLRLEKLSTLVYPELYKLQSTPGRMPKWTVALPNKNEWDMHGFCAQGPLTDLQERFIMPKRKTEHIDGEKRERWYSVEPGCQTDPGYKRGCAFDPRDYKTYGERKRWIRLPVDSKLSVDQQTTVWVFSLDIMFTDDWSTVMHPTGEGFAVNADSTLAAMKDLLQRKQNERDVRLPLTSNRCIITNCN